MCISVLIHIHTLSPGELETYNAASALYWWPGIRSFIKNYVKGCGTCQRFKIDRNPSHPSYIPVEGAGCTRPFAKISMDLITDLPPVDGYDSLLVVVDQGLSKGVILCPTQKTVDNNGIGKLLKDNVYKQFGLHQRKSAWPTLDCQSRKPPEELCWPANLQVRVRE